MKYNILILDDESSALALLRNYIAKIDELSLVGEFKLASEGKQKILNSKVDILLTDIEMGDISGVELLEMLEKPPITIFTSAYRNYAADGYNLNVIDFLEKPFSFERFNKAIQKAIAQLESNTKTEKDQDSPNHFFIKANNKLVRVETDDIYYIESYGEYVKIHTNTSTLIHLQRMNNMEEALPKEDFMRVHRSYIVNLKHIKEIEKRVIILSNGEHISVSTRMKEAFLQRIMKKGIK